MVKYLTLLGADVDIKTPLGLGAAHLAAQGDFPHIIAFFGETGISLIDSDSKLSTPLHLASYVGAYYAVSVLTTMNATIDLKNKDGHTPLHLAVLSDNSRIVRLLLLKGADKKIKDCKGRTALSIANDDASDDIHEMLKNEGILVKCGCRPMLSPYKQNSKPFVSLVLLLLTISILSVSFFQDFNVNSKQTKLLFVFLAGDATVLALLVIIYNSNPGYVLRSHEDKLSVCLI